MADTAQKRAVKEVGIAVKLCLVCDLPKTLHESFKYSLKMQVSYWDFMDSFLRILLMAAEAAES